MSEHCLSFCNDERTREFACALIDFARWDLRRSGKVLEGSEKYQWPAYIYNMISKPRDWAVWRQSAERRALRDKVPKRIAYLLTMQEEYLVTSEAEDNDDSESENSSFNDDDDVKGIDMSGSNAEIIHNMQSDATLIRGLRGSPLKSTV